MNSLHALDTYKKNIDAILDEIIKTQSENINKAADLVARSLEKDGIIYITGSGHSHMIAEEIFYRAGGLAAVYPILEPSLMLHLAAERSSDLEKLSGLAPLLLKNVSIGPKDLMIVISNSGRNSYPIEMILEAKKIGCPTIVITSLKHSTRVRSRHSSNKKLYELADLVIDNCGVYGDASVEVKGIKNKMGATSTIAGTFIIQGIVLRAVEILQEKNIVPDIFLSANIDLPEGEDHADDILKKWRKRIHIL